MHNKNNNFQIRSPQVGLRNNLLHFVNWCKFKSAFGSTKAIKLGHVIEKKKNKTNFFTKCISNKFEFELFSSSMNEKISK